MMHHISNKKFLLSICIPTVKERSAIFCKVLESIVDQEEFLSGSVQICISCNSTNNESEEFIHYLKNKFPDFIKYTKQKRNIYDKNFQAVLSMADGEYLKLNNDNLIHKKGSLLYLLQEIKSNKEKLPMIFSTNIYSSSKSLDEFIKAISYNVTYIGGHGFWKKDLPDIINLNQVTKQLWQVEAIFYLVSKYGKAEIRPSKLMKTLTVGSKGGYPFNKVFIDSYLTVLNNALKNKVISAPTFKDEKKKLLLNFCAKWAGLTIARVGSYHKKRDHFNYLIKWYKDTPFVLFLYVFFVLLHSIKQIQNKFIHKFQQYFFQF